MSRGIIMKITDHFYTITQAAAVLGVNRLTIWRRTKQGELDIERIGREVLIPKWQVELIKIRGKSK
jgi:excisionase family DNA binding protein